MQPMTTLNITPVNDPDELHHEFEEGEVTSPPVELTLDPETGEMWCGRSPHAAASAKHARCCPIPALLTVTMPAVTAERANRLMQDVAELAQQVLDGVELGWRDDAEWRDRIAKGWARERQMRTLDLTESARQAWQQIQRECQDKSRFPAEITLKPGDLRPSFWEALVEQHGDQVWAAETAWRKQQ